MVKTLLAVTAFIICVLWGKKNLLAFKERQDIFKELLQFVRNLRTDTVFLSNDIGTILQKRSSGKLKDIFMQINANLESVGEIRFDSTYLRSDEKKAVCELFRDLGQTDKENLENVLQAKETEFLDLYERMREERVNKGDLFSKLSIAIGLGCFIILI